MACVVGAHWAHFSFSTRLSCNVGSWAEAGCHAGGGHRWGRRSLVRAAADLYPDLVQTPPFFLTSSFFHLGLTPMMQLLRQAHSNSGMPAVSLIFYNKTAADIFLKDEVRGHACQASRGTTGELVGHVCLFSFQLDQLSTSRITVRHALSRPAEEVRRIPVGWWLRDACIAGLSLPRCLCSIRSGTASRATCVQRIWKPCPLRLRTRFTFVDRTAL